MTQEHEDNAPLANIGDPVANLCARAEALCRQIAPHDLDNLPLYIVPLSRITGILGGPSVCDGFTSHSLDLYLRDDIGSSWRGRGPCMVINDLQYGDATPEDNELAFSRHGTARVRPHPRTLVVVPRAQRR